MASTNKTQNLELSQYIGTDKPTYLGDYNSDMLKIDTASGELGSAIQTVAGDLNSTDAKIGTLANLTTTEKTTVVGAINEVNSNAEANTTKIGTLANLTTTDKTTVVNAINEVNSKTIEQLSTTVGTKTGKKWIDGRDIYAIVVDGLFTSGDTVLSSDKILLDVTGKVYLGGVWRIFPFYEIYQNLQNLATLSSATTTGATIRLESGGVNTNANVELVIEYLEDNQN